MPCHRTPKLSSESKKGEPVLSDMPPARLLMMPVSNTLQPHMTAKFVETDMAGALAARAERDAVLAKAREAIG